MNEGGSAKAGDALAAPIRVKLIGQTPARSWLHQFPDGRPRWGRLAFTFERQARDYDWLVVYDEVPPLPGQKRAEASEPLSCHPAHTLLVTTEPSSIKYYGEAYTGQFGAVLTSQEPWALRHPRRIYAQPALQWFYGVSPRHCRPFAEMAAFDPSGKTQDLSMVFSPKRMRHTLHHRRFAFMRRLIELMPEMAVFGRGARPLEDKAEALDPYRHHVVVENHIAPHHWTEKLADAFLGLCLPFYSGCPNVAEYFPAESFIPIDLHAPEAAARIIRRAIADNEYERRLPAILEARRRVLYEYNLFAVLAREIPLLHDEQRAPCNDGVIRSRHALRRRSPRVAVQDLWGKVRTRAVNAAHRVHLLRPDGS